MMIDGCEMLEDDDDYIFYFRVMFSFVFLFLVESRTYDVYRDCLLCTCAMRMCYVITSTNYSTVPSQVPYVV